MMNVNKMFLVNAVRWGLITGGLFILFQLIVYIFSIELFSPVFGIISFLLTLGILLFGFIYGTSRFREKHMGGVIKFSRSFISCLIIGVVSSLLLAIYNYLFYAFYEPGLLESMAEKYIEMFADNPNIPEEQVEVMAESIISRMKPLPMALGTVLNTSIMSVVLGLIAALFIRKKDKSGDQVVY